MLNKLSHWLLSAVTSFVLATPAMAQFSSFPPGSQLDVPPGGQVDFGCVPLDMGGTLNLSGGTLSVDSSASFGTTASVTGTGGVISVGGDLIASGGLNTGANSLILRDGCDPGNSSQISGNFVVQNLTVTSSTGRTFVLPAGANITVLGTLTVQGTPGQSVQLVSSGGTAVISLGPNATVIRSFASVPPTVQIGAAPVAVAAVPSSNFYSLLLMTLLVGGLAAHRRLKQR